MAGGVHVFENNPSNTTASITQNFTGNDVLIAGVAQPGTLGWDLTNEDGTPNSVKLFGIVQGYYSSITINTTYGNLTNAGNNNYINWALYQANYGSLDLLRAMPRDNIIPYTVNAAGLVFVHDLVFNMNGTQKSEDDTSNAAGPTFYANQLQRGTAINSFVSRVLGGVTADATDGIRLQAINGPINNGGDTYVFGTWPSNNTPTFNAEYTITVRR